MNNTARKYPRTMAEAFGPYTSRELHAKPDERTRRQRIADVLGWLLALCVLAAMVMAPHWWPR